MNEALENSHKEFADSIEKREDTLPQKLKEAGSAFENNLTPLLGAIKEQNETLNDLDKPLKHRRIGSALKHASNSGGTSQSKKESFSKRITRRINNWFDKR